MLASADCRLTSFPTVAGVGRVIGPKQHGSNVSASRRLERVERLGAGRRNAPDLRRARYLPIQLVAL